MPILSNLESKTYKGRLIHLAVFVVLLVGGVTMVYPFLVMLSGSVRSEADQSRLTLVPEYLVNTTWVYRKFIESKYNQEIISAMRAHGRPYYSFAQVPPPPPIGQSGKPGAAANTKASDGGSLDSGTTQAVKDLTTFINDPDLPRYWQRLGGIRGYQNVPRNLRIFRDRLGDRFDDDLDALSKSLGSPVRSWLNITLPEFDWLSPRFDTHDNVLYEVYFNMLDEAPAGNRQLVSLTGSFLTTVIFPNYGQQNTREYNADHARDIGRYDQFTLPRTAPGKDQATLRAQWIDFVTEGLNPAFIGLKAPEDKAYRAFLRDRYGNVKALNQAWGESQSVDRFEDLTLPAGKWMSGQKRLDYADYLNTKSPDELRLVGPDYAYRDYLKEHYQSVKALNAAYGTGYASFAAINPPMDWLEYAYALNHRGQLRWEFLTGNYINVFNELVFQGRPLFNTVVFVILCVVLALLINPLGAYAMSRFDLPGTYKILLIIMATTAFPQMVTLIPQFIVLRKLHLLNTFAALVLPFIINGYLVFLLKGFFDSLPGELYDAARIDGAGEARMFFQITMALSKPILAVLGLQVFTAAYTAFLYPLLIAPDEDMWLISVWIYQFQQRSSTAAVYASVVVASIPTLVVFLFAQRTIMRGIVVPTEK